MSILIRKVPGGRSLFYASRGPVSDFYNIDLTKRLIKELEPLKKKYKPFVLKMDPEVAFSEELHKLYEENGFIVTNREAAFEEVIQPRNNMIIYLGDHDEESIMSEFSGKNRNRIRSAKRKGVYTDWGTSDEHVQKFYEVYEFMAKRNKISYREIDYFYNMRDALGDRLRVYLTYHEEDLLSGSIAINYYGKVYYLYAGSNNTKRNLYPNQRMNYEIITWAIEEGAEQYDLGGVFAMDEKDGLYQFKKHFWYKREVTEYIGEIDYVFNKFYYFLYKSVVPKLQKLKKRLARRG